MIARLLLIFLFAFAPLGVHAEQQRMDSYPWAKSSKKKVKPKKAPSKRPSKKKPGKKAKAEKVTKAPEPEVKKVEAQPRVPAAAPAPAPVVAAEAPASPFPGSVPIVAATAPSLTAGSGHYLREFESGFGQLVLGTQAVSFNALYRFRVSSRRALYAGVDMQFALFSTGHYFGLLPGVWHNWTLRAAPLLTLSLGALAGPAFCHLLTGLPDTSVGAFGEMSISFELDDLATVRGQFRSGIVGGRVAFGTHLLVGFRFR